MRTLVFPGPSIKLPPIEALSFGCRLAIARIEPPFAVTADEWIRAAPASCRGARIRNAISSRVAERFLGVPYLWGGKTSLGLDCSALVQLSLTACGAPCWRDSDMQEQSFLPPIEPAADLSNLQRGDLMFWDGHVAIVRDTATLIHANALSHGGRDRADRGRGGAHPRRRQRDLERPPAGSGVGSIAAAAIDHVLERHADLEAVDLAQDVGRRSRAATTARRCAA